MTAVSKAHWGRAARFALVGMLLLGIALAFGGCDGSPRRLSAPSFNPTRLAATIFKERDANGDGAIDEAEMAGESLLAYLAQIADIDHDRRLSLDEATQRIGSYRAKGIGRASFTCFVICSGVPVADAEVTLSPAGFFGSSLPVLKGITGPDGYAVLEADDGAPGVPFGIYLVKISKLDSNGNELIADCYNSRTQIYQELSIMNNRGDLSVTFPVTIVRKKG